jgi:hypothetical protein
VAGSEGQDFGAGGEQQPQIAASDELGEGGDDPEADP